MLTRPEEFENEGFTLKTNQMFSDHTTSEEFENEDFTLKMHQMFSVHTTPEEFENEGFTLKKHQMFSVHTTPFGEDSVAQISDTIFSKDSLFKIVPHHVRENKKSAFLNSSGLKRVFEKLRFCDGLVWMVGLTVEIEPRFQISPL